MSILPISHSAADPGGRRQWSLSHVLTIGFLGITAGIQMSDRGLQAILLQAIQKSFAVSDATIGALQGLAGVLVGSAIAVPLARLADSLSRKRVLLGLIAAWAGLMALSALAPDFPLFFVGRAASGVTEFAMIPIVYSLIPDLAPERHRVAANLSFAALMAAGASAGYYFGSAIVDAAQIVVPLHLEAWRKAMLLLAMAGLPLFVFGLLISDPPRAIPVAGHEHVGALMPFLRERWQAIGLFIGVAGSLMIAVQALNPLIALALERGFKGDIGEIGHALGLVTLATSLGSLPLAGLLDRGLSRHLGLAARPLIMGASALLSIPCIALLLTVTSVDHALIWVAVFLFLTCIANALVPTMLQDLTPASLRARSFALWSFVVSIFCAIGPLVAGTLSDLLLHGALLSAIAVTALPALLLSAGCAAKTVIDLLPRRGRASARSAELLRQD